DPDAKDDITTINQLTLPVNRPVLVHLSTKDVIHSFGLYEMRVKQDVIPGLDTPVWFIPNRIGDYEIACSQLCGLGHYRMRGFVIGIGEQRKIQIVFLRELRLARLIEDADAEDDRLVGLELWQVVAKIAGLLRASGCVVLRIEVEDDRTPFVVAQPMRLAVLIL